MIYYVSIKNIFEKNLVVNSIKEFDNKSAILEGSNEKIKKADIIICDYNLDIIDESNNLNKIIIINKKNSRTPEKILVNKRMYTYEKENELREILNYLVKKKKRVKKIFMFLILILILSILILTTTTIIKSNSKEELRLKEIIKQKEDIIKLKDEEIKKKDEEIKRLKNENETKELNNMVDKSENVVFLGDSITYFYDIDKYYEGMHTVKSAYPGLCTDDIIKELEEYVYIYNPTKVVLLIGTNDLRFRDYGNKGIANKVQEIIKKIKKNRPKTKIYVQSVYPINKESDSKKIDLEMIDIRDNKNIEEVNKYIKEVCKTEKVEYIDIYNDLLDDSGNLNLDYTEDGLHISEKGYEVITDKIKKSL